MKMNVATRLAILTNLPEQGSVVEMISKRNVRNKIDFTSEEITNLNLIEENGRITWTPSEEIKDIDFNSAEIAFLKKTIESMDQRHLITENILDFTQELLSIE